MFCIVAFVVLSILGIFSATHRELAHEALDCVFRRVTLRPCNTGFDEKMKARILGSVITRSETAARFLNKNFELLAWVFFLLMLTSGAYTLRSGYLFYVTGSCNGLNSSAFCVFDPTESNNQVSTSETCQINPTTETDLSLDGVDLSTFPVMNAGSEQGVVMIGCYHCEYTRKAYPMIRDLADRFDVQFYFLNYPVKEVDDSFTRLGYCAYQQDPQKFWDLNDRLFQGEMSLLDDPAYVDGLVEEAGLEKDSLQACLSSPQTQTAVLAQMNEAAKTQFFGTPTVFIHDQAFVGPKPYRVYAIALKGLFYWAF
ncbi:MAG: thioredoxin domain-containing protein [Chloroflexi bacterium]|nr:thioredoxin domain-containing protein [Chloroflexota bacterium]